MSICCFRFAGLVQFLIGRESDAITIVHGVPFVRRPKDAYAIRPIASGFTVRVGNIGMWNSACH